MEKAQRRRREALHKEVQSKDQLWNLIQQEERFKRLLNLNQGYDTNAIRTITERNVPRDFPNKNESAVDTVQREPAAREEIV